MPIGVLPVDAIFSPVRRVNYRVERARVGQITDYERLVLEIWTDMSATPMEVLPQASQILVDHFFLFTSVGKVGEAMSEKPSLALSLPAEVYNTSVEKLELSARTLNSLKRAHINKVGEVLERERSDLLKIRNFGDKSLEELYGRLDELGFLPEEQPDEQKPLEDEGDRAGIEDLEPVGASEEEEEPQE